MEAKLKSILIALVTAAGGLTAHAAKPSWSYRVLRSPHFELVFRDNQRDLAKRYIVAAEQAHELVFPLFKEGPSKTIIVLQDDTDLSNGSADFLPYAHITVYPVLPSTLDTIDEYGDWPLEMMIHEYTHILNMYPAHGIYVPFKYIFGSIVRPNAVLPRWYLEGLAVYTESALSDRGRLRSTDTSAAARALVLENRLRREDLPRINEGEIPTWPYGSRPYLFGGWWWEGVRREKGDAVIETWNQNFSRRLPFLLNAPMREQMNQSASEMLGATASRLETRAKEQMETVKAAGVIPSKPVAAEGGEQSVFAISPSGNKLIYWVGSVGQGSQVKLKVRASPGQEWSAIPGLLLFKSTGSLRVRWIDEERVIFDQLDIRVPFVTYRDLYIYNLKTNDVKRLTEEARAQEPSPSPGGRMAVFIQNDGGRNHLSLVTLEDGAIRPLLHGSLSQRISSPEFVNENEIVFVLRERGGEEVLKVYNLQTRSVGSWNETLRAAQNLRKTANGFLISDSGSGVRNIFWIHEGKTEALTNTLTNIEVADFDGQRQELVISELTGSGRRLRAIPFAARANPPAIEGIKLEAPPQPGTTKVRVTEGSYQPLSYLWPRYWFPWIYQADNAWLFQGMTSNSDPAGRNSYSLSGSYDTITQRGSYGAAFVNRSLPTDIGLTYANSASYLGASGATVKSESAGLSFTQSWPFQNRAANWTLGGVWADTEAVVRRMGPWIGGQYSRLDSPLNRWFGWSFDFNHSEYIKSGDYLAYGRSYLHVTNVFGVGQGNRLYLQARAALAPRLPMRDARVLGDRTVGGNYVVNLVNSEFLMRGYPSGEFVGRKILNANLEYVLPAFRVDKGWGTFPMFLRHLEVALFTDAVSVDGGAWDANVQTPFGLGGYVGRKLNQFSLGSGMEARLHTTAGYQVPLSFTLGLYYGYDRRFGGGFSPFFGIGFGGLSGIQANKTP